MEIFKLKPQKPHGSFGEQVMFLAHVSPSFPSKGAAFPGEIITALDEHYEVMHANMRETLVSALILLRNRDQFPCIRTLPLYFKLFGLADKNLRKQIFTHIVRDLTQMHRKAQSQKSTKELRDLFFDRLEDGGQEVSRRACAMFITMFRKNIWRDNHSVNLMSAGLVHPDVKIAASLAHLFLGNKTKGLEGILEESEDEDVREAKEVAKELVNVKKTGRREKRLKRAQQAAKRVVKKKSAKDETSGIINFIAIDLLHDPQTLAEKLLARAQKGGEPFLFRLLILHLCSRLISRHLLVVPNLYPFMLKYLNPTQSEVTQVLACLVEASHNQIPPDDLRPTVLHVLKNFVTEVQAPEVIEVGLNAIREICSRAVSILNEEELADLSGFRKFKHKGVTMAAKSLINTYREIDPQLLHRSLRGRQAAMAISRGELVAPQFGSKDINENIEGIDLLLAKKRKQLKKGEELEGENAQLPEGVKEGEDAGKALIADQVLSSEDFKQLRKLRLQRSVELQLGRKRKAEEIESSDDGSDNDSDDSESTDVSLEERGLSGRLPGAVSAAELKAKPKKARTKAERLAKVKEGRVDFKEKMLAKQKDRKGGKTNQEQKRMKPHMMSMQSADVKKKKQRNAKDKLKTMKKHIKTLKKTANHQKIRRR